MRDLVTKSEAQSMLQCNPVFIECAIESHELAEIVQGGVTYFRRCQIEAILSKVIMVKPRDDMHIVEVRLGREL